MSCFVCRAQEHYCGYISRRVSGEFSDYSESRFSISYSSFLHLPHFSVQAQKFPGNYSLQYDIRQAHYPRDVFNLARKYDQFKRIDWEEQKEGFMTKALDAKFKLDQHRSLYFKLLSTGTAKLHEHTANDMYWGDGGDGGNGVDRLGHLLWRIRGSIREFEERRLKEAGFEVNVAKMKDLWRQIEEERERMIRDIVMVKESLK
ncbi:hypothetical protein BC938DRAFT_470603 [Jimgerdemannia flammicorona]|uniref:NADAR domain-containing protein n=1 Tax=Jimgerdemannia flammicorona TaxID=994334 RepID=A0A433QV43_9FUNG|nr:hypothetical protein BC938DRAFT_470603 [Jimgerdemannia flammicorona]